MKNIVMSTICLLLLGIVCLSPAPAVSADEIKSRAAVVMDAETGKVLFAKNPDLRLMPASTTKLMTALVVLERTDVRDAVTVSGRAKNAAEKRLVGKLAADVTGVKSVVSNMAMAPWVWTTGPRLPRPERLRGRLQTNVGSIGEGWLQPGAPEG